MTDVVVGIDLGGTASRFVSCAGDQVLAATEIPTATFGSGSWDDRIDRLSDSISGVIELDQTLRAVGIGASGPMDVEAGIIRNPFTLPALSGEDIVSALGRRLGLPVVLDNDAVVAAVAEHRVGAGMGAQRLLVVTIGTGIGVALLVNGKPFRAAASGHPEAGHIPIPEPTPEAQRVCYCGAVSCWEQSASRKALQKMLRPYFPAATSDRDVLNLAAAASERPEIVAALERYGVAMGHGLAILHSVYAPDVTVLAGSGAKYLDLYRKGLERALQRAPGFTVSSALRVTTLGNAAGAIGAALLAQDQI